MKRGIWFFGLFGSILILRGVRFTRRNVDGFGLGKKMTF